MGLQKTVFGRQKIKPNTFIGGVSGTINTPALVASKLGISASRIKAFSIIGSDIQFAVTGGNYNLNSQIFRNNTDITYYYDVDGLVTGLIGSDQFNNATNLRTVKFKNLTSVSSAMFYNTKLSGLDNDFSSVTNVNTTGAGAFSSIAAEPNTVINLPNLNSIGLNVTFQGHSSLSNNITFRVPLALMTSNAGKPDARLTTATLKAVNIEYIGYVDDTSYNTQIGNYQNIYSNKGLLAQFLGVGSGAIINFQNTVSDLRFKCLVNYIISNAKYQNNTIITYYYDLDGLVTQLNGSNHFNNAINLTDVKFKGITVIPPTVFNNTGLIGTNSDFSSVTSFSGALQFSNCPNVVSLSFPSLLNCGNTVGNDSVFNNIKIGVTITVPVALQSANAGAPDGDLVYASGTRGATIVYV